MVAHSILFVCLGNICRSPLAEGAFRTVVQERGLSTRFKIDSAGTGDWHAGDPPDHRSIAVARKYGIDISRQRARQISRNDFSNFGLILGMDRSNVAALEELAPTNARGQVHLFLDFAGEAKADVPDPYCGDADDFENVYRMVRKACESIAERLS